MKLEHGDLLSIPVIFLEHNSHDPFLPMNRPVSFSPGTTGSTLIQSKGMLRSMGARERMSV